MYYFEEDKQRGTLSFIKYILVLDNLIHFWHSRYIKYVANVMLKL